MKGNASYSNASGNYLPLDAFFAALRRGGIGVTPAQMAEANKLLLQYAPSVPNEAALCQYLCPLFATNQAEQARFKEIFAAQFSTKETEALPPLPPPPTSKKWLYLLVLLPILLLVWWIGYNRQVPRSKIVITFSVKNSNDTTNEGDGLNQHVKGDSLQAFLVVKSNDTSLAQTIQRTAVYKWGDNTPDDTTGRHVYKTSGIYKAQALVQRLDEGNAFTIDTIVNYISICDFPNGLVISSTAKDDSIPVNKPIYFSATVAGNALPDSIVWSVYSDAQVDSLSELNRRALYKQNERLGWQLKTEGSYTVSCTIIYGNADGPCTYSRSMNIYANDPNKPLMAASLQPAANAKPLKPAYKVKRDWFWIFGGGVLACLLLSMVFRNLYRKLQRAQQPVPIKDAEYDNWLSSFASTKPPGNIPFLNKNALAPPEPIMAAVGRLMRRRIASEAMYMHIGKTIAKAVHNSGFFRPAMEPRTQQSEYLLLIEESHINGQLTQLFTYLADTLHRHNVFVEKYYYRYEPSLCYSTAAPNGITLERLSEKYPHHILVLAGHAHQLIYPYQPMVSPYYQKVLSRWHNKAILTPLPFADWGVAEKDILPTVIPVFPADTSGHLLMMQWMADKRINVPQQLKERQGNGYSIIDIDFHDIDELAAYCQLADWAQSKEGSVYHNLLFQWIAALAVYPKLQWELILAIGKALLEKSGLGHQLNFSNLLRLTRISWMQEGIMPPELRLALLKQLQPENEVLARQTILASLKEIPSNDLKPGDATYEEKETQRIINEFNLYAYDPIKYAAYRQSASIFERLWNDKKLMEAPVKKYLRNPHAQWPTLINSRLANGTTDVAYVPLDDYFKPLPPITKGLAKLYKVLGISTTLLIGVCLIGLLGMVALQLANTKRFPLFTEQKKQLNNINFIVRDSASRRITKEVFLRIGDSTATFTNSGNLQLPLSDSDRVVAIAVNGKAVFDTFMPIDRDRYLVILKDKLKENGPVSKIKVVFFLSPVCAIQSYVDFYNSTVRSVDSNLVAMIDVKTQTGKGNSPSTCLRYITSGRGVDIKLVDKLIEYFKQYDVKLIRRYQVTNIPDNNEIYIEGENDISKEKEKMQAQNESSYPPVMPEVYIQINDPSMKDEIEAFKKDLQSKGYVVVVKEVREWQYFSQIYYFDENLETETKEVKKIFETYFPEKIQKIDLKTEYNDLYKEARIAIIMKKFDKKEEINIIGQQIVSIAQKEIGTSENPPGSNKTKYGESYNAKMNKLGMPWSAAFVSWVYDQAGQPLYLERGGSGFASFASLLQYANSEKLLTTEPQPGDIVVIDLLTNSYQGGIFVRWIDKEAGKFETVEGNIALRTSKNGEVGKGTRSIKTAKVYFVHVREPAQGATGN